MIHGGDSQAFRIGRAPLEGSAQRSQVLEQIPPTPPPTLSSYRLFNPFKKECKN